MMERQKPWPELLKKNDIPDFTGLPLSYALTVLRDHGVSPIDTGRGPYHGLRWHRDAVKNVMDTLHAEAQKQPAKKIPRKPKKAYSILGKSANTLFADLCSA